MIDSGTNHVAYLISYFLYTQNKIIIYLLKKYTDFYLYQTTNHNGFGEEWIWKGLYMLYHFFILHISIFRWT